MAQFIAVDLGGTNIRVAYFPKAEPPPSTQSKTPTLATEGPDAVIERLCQAIEGQMPKDRTDLSIGIGAPGPLDPRHGMVLKAVNLPGWEMIPLKSILETRFVCPVFVGNDANLAALGEWRFGAGQGTSDLIYLTISTGIGGGECYRLGAGPVSTWCGYRGYPGGNVHGEFGVAGVCPGYFSIIVVFIVNIVIKVYGSK